MSADDANEIVLTELKSRLIKLGRRREAEGNYTDQGLCRAAVAAIDDLMEHQAIFELRWHADKRAIERWRAAAPGRQLTLPDHTDLLIWLLEQLNEGKGGWRQRI